MLFESNRKNLEQWRGLIALPDVVRVDKADIAATIKAADEAAKRVASMSEFWAHLDFDGMRAKSTRQWRPAPHSTAWSASSDPVVLISPIPLGGTGRRWATVSDEITLGATKAVDGRQAIPVIYDSMSPARRREVALRAAALLVTTLYYLKALMEQKTSRLRTHRGVSLAARGSGRLRPH